MTQKTSSKEYNKIKEFFFEKFVSVNKTHFK